MELQQMMNKLNYSKKCLLRAVTVLFVTVSTLTLHAQNIESGLASYYHDSLEGNRTASGQIFHQSKFTAAHKTLSFGTWVLVEDKEGDDVVVRINDRLPARSTRMIDLTMRAAEELQLIRKGIERVDLKIITPRDAWLWYLKNGFCQSLIVAY